MTGCKKNRDHIGRRSNYIWNKEMCIKEMEIYSDDHQINYSALARQFDLKNVIGKN